MLVNGLLYPLAAADSDFHLPTPLEALKAVLLMGVPVTLGLLGFAAALLMSTSYGTLTPFMFTAILFSYLVSVLRYGEHINLIGVAGAAAIVVGIVLIVRNKDPDILIVKDMGINDPDSGVCKNKSKIKRDANRREIEIDGSKENLI